MLRFALVAAAAFAAMEVASYVLHRWLLHGPLWRMHRTHHDPAHGHGHGFEWNDLFSLAWTLASMGLIWAGWAHRLPAWAAAIGVGIAVYGVLYFLLHDLYAHGRLGSMRTSNPAAQAVKRAHGRHHQSLTQRGQEPYGLFLFPPWMGRRFERRRDRASSR